MSDQDVGTTPGKKKRRKMTILWIVLGIVAVLILVPVLIGLLMPERYEGQTKVFLANSPEEVWVALQNYESHPMTGKMMKSAEVLPKTEWVDDLPAWVEDMGHGERITVKTVEADRPVRLVREMASASMPMTSRWVYTLEEADGGSDLNLRGCHLTLHGETYIRRGSWMVPIFRFMMVVGGGVKKGLDIQIDMVAKTLGVDARRAA